MKLNSPFFNLSRSEGMAISNPHFYNKWQGWALAQNPLAYWNFNTTTGPFVDITGRSASVIPGTGMVLGAAGAVPGSLALTGLESLGTSGFATVAYTGAISGNFSQLTVEMLVKLNSFLETPKGAAALRGHLFRTAFSYPFSIKYRNDASVPTQLDAAFSVYSAVDETYYTAQFSADFSSSDTSKWYHLALALNTTTGSYILYINGIPIGEIVIIDPTPAANYVVLTPTDGNWRLLGTSWVAPLACPHSMDELIIYDKCLTQEEVSMRFAQTGLTNGYVVPPG